MLGGGDAKIKASCTDAAKGNNTQGATQPPHQVSIFFSASDCGIMGAAPIRALDPHSDRSANQSGGLSELPTATKCWCGTAKGLFTTCLWDGTTLSWQDEALGLLDTGGYLFDCNHSRGSAR
uniref:Uncharacterized protein n=1 Tax=Eutreptiella gymnastica TaxID=73025 RepID=A0A7S4LJ77_9EUGL